MGGPTYKVANGMGCFMQNNFKATIHKISQPTFVIDSLLICLYTGITLDTRGWDIFRNIRIL